MELSAIGEQVFAVESIVKKRVRKVTLADYAKNKMCHFPSSFFFFFCCGTFGVDMYIYPPPGMMLLWMLMKPGERLNKQNCEANLVI